MPLPPLTAIRCFEAVARHLNFTRAAEELGMTQAAVSYQIRLLEDRLGPLFLRRHRGVELSEAGRRLAPGVRDAFDGLRAAFEEFDAPEEETLSVSGVSTFTSNWLVPRLGRFRDAHPSLSVRLDVASHMVDFGREEVDVGIRSGKGDWPGLALHRLMPIQFAPMLSPGLLDASGPVDTPADLLRLPLIGADDPWWVQWFAEAGVDPGDLAKRRSMLLHTQQLCGQAALAGQGVAILTPCFFREDLEAGRLVQPFPAVREPGCDYWLVYPEARRRTRRIVAFRDWLLRELAGEG